MTANFRSLMGALCLTPFFWVMSVDTVDAQTPVTYTDGGNAIFHIGMPDFWEMRSGGIRVLEPDGPESGRATNRIMGFSPTADESAFLALVSPVDVRTLEEGQEYLANVGRFLVEDVTVTETKKRRIAGLPSIQFDGTGNREGRSVAFTALVIDLPNGRVAVAVAVVEAGVTAAEINDLNAMFASIRPAR